MNKSHVEVSFSWVLANMHWICKAFYGGAWFCCAEMCVSSECLYNKSIAFDSTTLGWKKCEKNIMYVDDAGGVMML